MSEVGERIKGWLTRPVCQLPEVCGAGERAGVGLRTGAVKLARSPLKDVIVYLGAALVSSIREISAEPQRW